MDPFLIEKFSKEVFLEEKAFSSERIGGAPIGVRRAASTTCQRASTFFSRVKNSLPVLKFRDLMTTNGNIR